MTDERARNFPIVVEAEDGRQAYVELVDGKLVGGGDLPTDEAAKVFLLAMAEGVVKLQELKVEQES